MDYLSNAFSLNMLHGDVKHIEIIDVGNVEADIIYDLQGLDIVHLSYVKSVIGHEDTARLIERRYGWANAVFNRESVTLIPGDTLVVAQYRGPRLPEGVTELPEGAEIEIKVLRFHR